MEKIFNKIKYWKTVNSAGYRENQFEIGCKKIKYFTL